MILLYNLGIALYTFAIRIASLFHAKARQWLDGRKNWQERYAADWAKVNPEQAPTVWVHCASLGEFEQGRPVIEQLRRDFPGVKILLTFFSPSGYEIRKNYDQADYVCYLPADKPHNTLIFIEIFKPTLSIFVKYEFWLHYLRALHREEIPTLLISAIFRQNQIFFKPYGKLFRQLLPQFQHIFLQNEASAKLLKNLQLDNFSVAGDTRIDRVLQIKQSAPEFPVVQAFAADCKVLVVGSSWPPDEAILLPFINAQLPPDWRVIIAPHQIDDAHLQNIEKQAKRSIVRYSKATVENAKNFEILLIDNIGMLSALYRYGRIAYIGGGFGAGIHNTLEPIAFGLPVIFGPKYEKFAEARYLTRHGGAFTIENQEDMNNIFQTLQNEEAHRVASETAYQYVLDNQGASKQILEFIRQQRLLDAGF